MDDSLRGEEAALVAVQSALADRPGVLRSARALSHFGEHSIGWLVVAAVGALLQAKRRRAWLAAGVGAFAAHAAAVVIKRLVRRERPHHPSVVVNVGTPGRPASRLRMPPRPPRRRYDGTHHRLPLPALLVPPMALSRWSLAHYQTVTSVAVGAAAKAGFIADRAEGDHEISQRAERNADE
jgi:hypothetical protein